MKASTSSSRASRLVGLGVAAMAVSDALVVVASAIAAYWVRFEGAVSREFLPTTTWLLASAVVVYIILLWRFGLYRALWRYAGVGVLLRLAAAISLGTSALLAVDLLVKYPSPLDPDTSRLWPLSVVFALGVFTFVGTSAIRILPRTLLYVQGMGRGGTLRATLIIGAGDAGSLLLTDIEQQPELGIKVMGFLDDDKSKWGRDIRGVRILGPVSMLSDVVERDAIEEVFVAMPGASQDERRHVLHLCVEEGVRTRVMNALADLSPHVGVEDLRKVSIEDLLGRESVDIDVEAIAETIRSKVVAITGAAGSIGAELCRQVAELGPARLVLIDIDESRLYDLDQELLRRGAENVALHICDNRDLRKTTKVLVAEKPDLLFHAAAYKQVPIMELAPDEAVKTNVLGTRNVLQACIEAGVKRFVLISTDKAVHPTTVMGRTKAIAESLALQACRDGAIRVSAVRFGNVLGSRGSVVPLFVEQLRAGGPITVTHPEVTRYFMTIPEAARLVLQAQALSDEGAEIYVLDMGDPVKIVDLARKMIILSGADVEIKFTQLRPAEKLHEILTHHTEGMIPTSAPKILRASSLPLVPSRFGEDVQRLIDCSKVDDEDCIMELLESLADPACHRIRALSFEPPINGHPQQAGGM